MHFHIVIISPLLDVVKFFVNCSNARRAHQQVCIICEFRDGILTVSRVKIRSFDDIRWWAQPRPLDNGSIYPSNYRGDITSSCKMTPSPEIVHQPVMDVVWKVKLKVLRGHGDVLVRTPW